MNKNLGRKNYPTRDEYYTTPETAQRMFEFLDKSSLHGKTVYCNCDGPESEIYRYLKANFDNWHLKHLTATKYVKDGKGVKTSYDGHVEKVTQLEGDGRYESDECLEILKQHDVVCTNPPFSKINHFMSFVFKNNKDIIVIMNMVALINIDIRDYVIKGAFNYTSRFPGGGSFKRPNGDIACLNVISISTLKTIPIPCLFKGYTTQEFKDKGLYMVDDTTGILNIDYMRNIPIDYKEPFMCPTSVLISPTWKKYFNIFKRVNATVNGKQRFHRILVKMKDNVKAEDLLNDPYLKKPGRRNHHELLPGGACGATGHCAGL